MMRFVVAGLCAIMLLLAAGGIAYAVGLFDSESDKSSGSGKSQWLLYESPAFRFQIQYPADWTAEVSDYRTADPPQQGVRLSKGRNIIVAYVNFAGGWCESLGRKVEKDIEVNDIRGRETRCIRSGEEEPYQIVRQFEREGLKYTVWTEIENLELVEEIINTFRFTE
jgi:hypothetical protein